MTSTPVQIRRTMRQSTIGSADACLYRLHFIFHADTQPKGSVLRSVGTAYHAAIAEYYLKRRWGELHNGIVPTPDEKAYFYAVGSEVFEKELEEAEFFDWRYQPRGARQKEILWTHVDALNALGQAVDMYFDAEAYWPEKYDVMAVEMTFELPFMPGWTKSGTIDLVMRDTETGVHIVDDQKLTRKKWNKKKTEATNAQSSWYTHAWAEWSGQPVNNIDFTFSVLGLETGFDRWEAKRYQSHIDATLERGRMIASLIDQGGPYPPNPGSFLCSEAYCDFWKDCPFGAALNR